VSPSPPEHCTPMKLTEEQHCAVEAAQGKPVEVIDPQT
jgi:hypothetical protein